MAIKEEMKNGMKIVDNLDGMKNATEKLINASNGSYITICSELCRRLNT